MTAASRHHPDAQALEVRLAARLAAGLAELSESLPHDVTERLRVARQQAVARAQLARRTKQARSSVAASGGVSLVGVSGGQALLGAPAPWWQRAASVLPLIVLVLGLLAIGRFDRQEQMLAAAEIDAQLLADELPPTAYSDPGFVEYLRSPPP